MRKTLYIVSTLILNFTLTLVNLTVVSRPPGLDILLVPATTAMHVILFIGCPEKMTADNSNVRVMIKHILFTSFSSIQSVLNLLFTIWIQGNN